MLKRILIVAALALPLSITAQEVKFGHVNVEKLLSSIPEAQKAQKEVEDFLLKKKTEGEKMEAELKKQYEAYLQEAESLDEDTRKTREDKLTLKQSQLQTFAEDARKEATLKQQELFQPIQKKINEALKNVGQEQGLVYIFDDQQPLFISDKSIDVLPLVQKKLTATAPATKPAPKR